VHWRHCVLRATTRRRQQDDERDHGERGERAVVAPVHATVCRARGARVALTSRTPVADELSSSSHVHRTRRCEARFPGDEPGRMANEGPQHLVRITRAFYMGAHEVTRGTARAFVEATGYRTEAERDPSGGFGIDFSTGEVRQDPTVTWHDPRFPGFSPDDRHPVVLVGW
jgi:hypothetical protein